MADVLPSGSHGRNSDGPRQRRDMPYEPHPAFDPPDNEEIAIWRYMDLAKYLSVLSRNALYFPSADRLGDPFEGSYPRANLSARKQLHGSEEPSNYVWLERRRLLRATLVNSWHMSEYESAAMWRLYAREDAGIAIRSSFQSLVDALAHSPRPVHIGVVHYIDYEAEAIAEENFLRPFLYKRASFAYERELRAVLTSRQHLHRGGPPSLWAETGEYVPLDLDRLVAAVHVAPSARNWFLDVVQSATSAFSRSFTVVQSSMATEPIY